MSRYPNLIAHGEGVSAGRGNGFLRRKIFPVAGSFSFTLPTDIPMDRRGLVRVRGDVLGAGSGGSSANDASAINGSGTGGGFSRKELWIPRGSTISVVVGAAGPRSNTSPSNRAGGTSSMSVGSVSWQATGGGNAVGGQGSGGDINTKGGDRFSTVSNAQMLCGGSAGSPWGDGAPGIVDGTGILWRMPKFWDIDDFIDSTLFADFVGIGGGAHNTGTPGPTFGGGGRGGWNNDGPGGGGLVILYY